MNKRIIFDKRIFSSVFLFFLLLTIGFVYACNVRRGTNAEGCWDRDYGDCCGWVFRGFLLDNNKACAVGGPSTCPYPYSDYQTYSSATINKCPSGNDGDSCEVKAGWYCDTFFSGRWDASENKCVECFNGIETKIFGDSLGIYTDESGINGNSKCESGCPNVDRICDEKSPGSFLNSCVYGKTYFADKCSASCQLEDEKICRSSEYFADCTASPECDGKSPGSNVVGGSCDNNCKFVPSVSVKPVSIMTIPSCPPDSCQRLLDLVDSCYGSKCGDSRYDKRADIDKDKDIDVVDLGNVSKRCTGSYGDWCQERLDDPFDPCVTTTTTTSTTTVATTTIPTNCQILINKVDAAFGTTCGHPRWDGAADVNRDRSVDIIDKSLIETNKYNNAWCLEKLNQPDPCNPLKVEAKIDFLESPPSLSGLRIDIDGVAKYTDGGSVTLYPSSGGHSIRAYNFGMREFSHFFDSDCDGNGNYLDTKTNPYSFTMYEKSRTITLFYKVLTQIADLNYDGIKITGKLLGEDNNPIIERGGSHPSCSDPTTGTVFIHPNRDVKLSYYDGTWKEIGSADSSLTNGSFNLNWICPAGTTKIKAEYTPTGENWFYSSVTVEKSISCGVITTSTSTTTTGVTTTTTPPTGCIESIGYPGYEGISFYCSLPENICQQGDTIAGLLKVGYTCPSTPSIQISITGDGCSITDTFSAGRYYCSGPGCWYEYSWALPQLPSACLGKTVTVTVSSEGKSASKSIKLSTDPTRDERPTMPNWGDWSPSIIIPTDKVSYAAYAEDDKGLKEIQILLYNSRVSPDWQVVKNCSVSGTSASCIYTGGPYPLGTEICFRGNAIDIKGQEVYTWWPGARVGDCRNICSSPNDTDSGKKYDVQGNCTWPYRYMMGGCDYLTGSDFCSWEAEGRGRYCCGTLTATAETYWWVQNFSSDGTVVCCLTQSLSGHPCLDTKTINCKNILGEYYIEGKECKQEFYDCSLIGKTCSNGACVQLTTTTTVSVTTTMTTTSTTTTSTIVTTTSTIPITTTTVPPGVENCCNGVDDDGDGKMDGADTDCQNNVNLNSGTNTVCWWTEWHYYSNNADYSSGWFTCPSDYIIGEVKIEQYTEQNYDFFTIYDGNNNVRYYDSGEDGLKTIDMSSFKTDKIKFRFTSDSSARRDGVKVNSIVCSIPISTTTTTRITTTTSPITTTTVGTTTSSTTTPTTTTTTISPTTSTTTTTRITTTTVITTTTSTVISTTTVPPGIENCCVDGDEDSDGFENGADSNCQNNVDLSVGTNTVCWWTEWNDYSNNADYSSGWFTCPSGYIVGEVKIEQYTEQNYDFFTIYDGNNNVRYYDSGEDGLKTIDMSSFKTDKIKFRFTSDSSARRDGVKVDSITCYIPSSTTTTTRPTTTSTIISTTTTTLQTSTTTTTTTTVITTTSTTPITSTTTSSTTTTIISDFIVTGFNCNVIVNGYRCPLSYTNNLIEDANVLFLTSDVDGNILSCATLIKAPRGLGTIEPIFLCPRTKGIYAIDWIVYLASDAQLKNTIKGSTPGETKVVECR